MVKRKDVRTRNEIRERVEGDKKLMEGKEDDLEHITSDFELTKRTLETLEGGTAEGAEEVERHIQSAGDVTENVFNGEDENLEKLKRQAHEFEGELKDHRDATESDVEKISGASSRIRTRETINELEKANESALHDIRILEEHEKRIKEARERSNAIQERLHARINSLKRR